MIPEIGQFSLILAMCLALDSGSVAARRCRARPRRRGWRSRGRPRPGSSCSSRSRSVRSSMDFCTTTSASCSSRSTRTPLSRVLQIHRGMGRARRLDAVLDHGARDLDARGRRGQPLAARRVREPRARRARHRERGHHRVRVVHVESVHAARSRARGRQRPECAAARSGDDHPSADSVPRLRRIGRAVRVRRRRAA